MFKEALGETSPKGESGDFNFYTTPWVSGTRVAHFTGPVGGERKVTTIPEVLVALKEILKDMAQTCVDLGANSVIGMEVNIELLDPSGYRVWVVGTGAKLEALF